jgi:hypothetical protein
VASGGRGRRRFGVLPSRVELEIVRVIVTNSIGIYGYPNSSSTPASNACWVVLHDVPAEPAVDGLARASSRERGGTLP